MGFWGARDETGVPLAGSQTTNCLPLLDPRGRHIRLVHRESLGQRVQMAELKRPTDASVAKPEDVQPLGDLEFVDEVVVPVRGPRPSEVGGREGRQIRPVGEDAAFSRSLLWHERPERHERTNDKDQSR